MKKIFILATALSLVGVACRQETTSTETEVDIATQNNLDDQAIQHFLNNHYLNDVGIVKQFSSTDTADDHYSKLSQLNPQKLDNGTYYIVREGAQPNLGTDITSNSVIRLMSRTVYYTAQNTSDGGKFGNANILQSGLDTGNLDIDPMYFFTPQSKIDAYNASNSTSHGKSFFEIEGFSEALTKFKAFDKDDSELYNLQGVIIVPSRAAFARDAHYNYNNVSMRNKSFVFNFQVYKSTPR